MLTLVDMDCAVDEMSGTRAMLLSHITMLYFFRKFGPPHRFLASPPLANRASSNLTVTGMLWRTRGGVDSVNSREGTITDWYSPVLLLKPASFSPALSVSDFLKIKRRSPVLMLNQSIAGVPLGPVNTPLVQYHAVVGVPALC